MNILEGIWCVNELLSASLLIVYLGRDPWDAILYGFTYRFGDANGSTPFQLCIQWFSKGHCMFMPLACVKFMLLFWCTPIALNCLIVLSMLWDFGDTKVLMYNAAYVRCKSQRYGRDPGTFRVHCATFLPRHGGLLAHNCINNLLHFYTVFNIVISLSSISL